MALIVIWVLLMNPAGLLAHNEDLGDIDHAGPGSPGSWDSHRFFEGQSNQLVEDGVETKYARLEFLSVGADKEAELDSNPSARNSGYDKLIIWLKNVYRAWVSEGHSGSTRLLLLSFGLVGIIGIRRKLKKKP
ncbi:MAG: hypothetical protein PVF37_09600 [Desulfobacterales bacterium]